MARATVSEQGVQYLQSMANAIEGAVSHVKIITTTMLATSAEYHQTLGPHEHTLNCVLEEIAQATTQAMNSAQEISNILKDVADIYLEILEFDGFQAIVSTSSIGGTVGAPVPNNTQVPSGQTSGRNPYRAGNVDTNLKTIHVISDWIKGVNPHYGNPYFENSTVNCGACALSVEKRLGEESATSASLHNIGTDIEMELATGKTCIYMEQEEIAKLLLEQGSGAHFIAGINRRMPNGQPASGHWFNVFYDGQKIYTLDGQAGKVFEFPYDYKFISQWCVLI